MFGEEGQFFFSTGDRAGHRIGEQEALDDLPLDQGFGDDLTDVFRPNRTIEHVERLQDEEWLLLAEAMAAGDPQVNLVTEARAVQMLSQLLEYGQSPGDLLQKVEETPDSNRVLERFAQIVLEKAKGR